MYELLIPFLSINVLIAILFWNTLRMRMCPDCGRPLFGLKSSDTKTRCRNCGCESDPAGRIVMPGTPIRRVPVTHVAGLAAVLA